MGDFTFQVDLKGMIRLLSENLYSNDSVFLRELLQNAIDAIEARKLAQADFADGKIEVRLLDDGMLEFSDNGIGLTDEEIHSFLSVIGKSSKRGGDARQKGFIGQFGIGLLSCFLVADNIEVLTRSVHAAQAYRWLGQSSGAYSIEPAPDYTRIGTTVRLQMTAAMRAKYDADTIRMHLAEYGFLLPIPVWLEAGEECVQVNDDYIPFRESTYTKTQLIDFGEQVFERSFLDAIPLMDDGLRGCIFFSATPGNSATMLRHKIYLKNMLITEDGKELVPKWAFFAQCLLNADDLTPTASRESFYHDQKLSRARAQIEHCIIDYLATLTELDPHRLQTIISLHNMAIKSLAADNDRVFRLLFPFLMFSTNRGDVTGAQLAQTAKKTTVFFCSEVDAFRKMRPLLEDKKTLLVNAGYVYDAALIRRAMRANRSLKIKELSDEMIGDVLQPASAEQETLFETFLEQANAALRRWSCGVVLRSFAPPELASLFVPGAGGFIVSSHNALDEDLFVSEDFFIEADDEDEFAAWDRACLYVNAACPLVQRIAQVEDPAHLATLAEVLYLQAHMQGGHPLDSEKLRLLNANLTKLIELGLQ